MGKHKKTRKEKIIADLHRKIQIQASREGISYSQIKQPSIAKTIHAPIFREQEHGKTYMYLVHDIKKSFFITTSIIAFEILLYLIMQKNIISLLHK